MSNGGFHLPDALAGLAPTTPSSCPRCGERTHALANGRGRIDICGRCGTLDLETREGGRVFSLRDLSLRIPAAKAPPR